MIETGKIYPIPPQSFLRRLREFDRDLQLNFDPTHKVWSIWRRDPLSKQLSHVMNVVDPDGSYRELDGRVFVQLRANRWFAEHPEDLKKIMIDDFVEERDRQQKFVHDEMKHLAQDSSLKKKFEELREKAKSIPWEDWKKTFVLHDEKGNALKNSLGKIVKYKPHKSFFENGGKKPTTEEME